MTIINWYSLETQMVYKNFETTEKKLETLGQKLILTKYRNLTKLSSSLNRFVLVSRKLEDASKVCLLLRNLNAAFYENLHQNIWRVIRKQCRQLENCVLNKFISYLYWNCKQTLWSVSNEETYWISCLNAF